MNFPLELGKQIRILRIRQGIKQKELAEHLEMSPSFLSTIETGKRNPGIKTIKAVANALHVQAWELIKAAEECE